MAQNTLEQAESALGSVNVQRMLFSLQASVIDVGNRLLWENIDISLREQLVDQLTPILSSIQIRQGINGYRLICNETNNTDQDLEDLRINCKIILEPTRSVEFIAIDFIVTRSGVEFV